MFGQKFWYLRVVSDPIRRRSERQDAERRRPRRRGRRRCQAQEHAGQQRSRDDDDGAPHLRPAHRTELDATWSKLS